MIFFHVLFMSFGPGWINGWSNQFRCCDPWFLERMWKPSFLTILYPQQHLKGYAARWTEILYLVAEIHSTFFARVNIPPLLPPNGRKMSMFDFHWRASRFNENKGRCLCQKTILIVNITRQLQGKNEKNLKNKEIQKIAAKRYCLRYSFYHLEVASLKFDEWI